MYRLWGPIYVFFLQLEPCGIPQPQTLLSQNLQKLHNQVHNKSVLSLQGLGFRVYRVWGLGFRLFLPLEPWRKGRVSQLLENKSCMAPLSFLWESKQYWTLGIIIGAYMGVMFGSL